MPELYCLTGNAGEEDRNVAVAGSYRYYAHRLTREYYPRPEPDKGGTSGPIPFDVGTLTDGTDSAVRWLWNWHIRVKPRKDIIFDLVEDRYIDRVEVRAEGILRHVEVSVRGEKEERFRYIAGEPVEFIGNFDQVSPHLEGLNTWGRYVCLTLDQAWGRLYEVRIWGTPLERVEVEELVRETPHPTPEPQSADVTEAEASESELDYGQRERELPRIIPHPQQMRLSEGTFSLPEHLRISLATDASAGERFAADLIAGKLSDRLGIHVQLTGGDQGHILLGRAARRALARELTELGERPEGYVLHVSPTGVALAGVDEAGTFYAAQSLVSLIDQMASLGSLRLRCLTVIDWPQHSFRGVHIYGPGRDAIPFFKTYVRDFLSRLKLNKIIYETAAGIQFDSHPEINQAWEERAVRLRTDKERYPPQGHHAEIGSWSYLTKAEARELIDWCRLHHVELIPEIQSLSHCAYLLAAHPEIAEDPTLDSPHTFCPSNPRSYEILFDISQELYELFQPRTVSIGHDEWGVKSVCEKCKDRPAWEQFADDVLATHAFWKERGVRVAMWGDHLLEKHNGGERRGWTCRALPQIPRDIIIANWSAGVDPESVELFRKEGFDQFLFEYNAYFARPAILQETYGDVDVMGICATTWTKCDEYHLGIKGSLYAQVFTADNTWTPNHPPVGSENYFNRLAQTYEAAKEAFRGFALPSRATVSKRFVPLDLRPFANVGLSEGSFVEGADDLGPLPTGEREFAGVPFDKVNCSGHPEPVERVPFVVIDPEENEGRSIVVLENAWLRERSLPDEVGPIPVDAQVESLCFLHATDSADDCTFGKWYADVVHYVINYEDGAQETFPVIYGYHLREWNYPHGYRVSNNAHIYGGRQAWRGRTRLGHDATLFLAEWVNPHPDKPVTSLLLRTPRERATTTRPMLFAVTAVQLREREAGEHG